MPRLVHSNPSYCLHKATGQAVVNLNGRDIYLGLHGTRASKEAYDRAVGEWIANGRTLPTQSATDDLTVVEIIRDFIAHATSYYRRPDGSATNEATNFREALRPLKDLYGRSLAREFGPLALKAVRCEMIERGWCRTHINRQVNRIKHVFRWAAAAEIIPSSVHHGLDALGPLKEGRSAARESDPVKPVHEARVTAILPFVSRQVAGMIELQQLTGMRPGEACIMRGCNLDTTSKLWIYTPDQHKNTHRGHKRVVYLGPQAQEILKPFLRANVREFLFQPIDAEAERRTEMARERKTPISCGNSSGSNRRRKPRKQPSDQYTVTAYCRAIKNACDAAFEMPGELREQRRDHAAESNMSPQEQAKLAEERKARGKRRGAWRKENSWHPHQLRHSAATRLRKEFGLEMARIILGHKTMAVTELYAEQDMEAAKAAMMRVG